MNHDQVTVNKKYQINTAPLIASPYKSKDFFVGEVLHKTDNAAYVSPQPPYNPVPLYISYHWFEKEI